MLERQYAEEEERINELMEQERLNAMREEEQREREHAERQQRFATVLKQQIQANEEERLIEYERKREESRLGNLNSIAQMEAELEKQKQREAEKVRARRELLECNEQLKHFKAMEKEEDRIMDIRSRKLWDTLPSEFD